VLAGFGRIATAQEWTLTYGLQYTSSWAAMGDQRLSYTQILPSFGFRLRGSLTATGGLFAEVTATGWDWYTGDVSLSTRAYALNVFSTRPTYSFLLSGSRSQLSDLSGTSPFNSTSEGLSATVGLRPWRDTFVSLQYLTADLDSTDAAGALASATSSVLAGAFARLNPLALTYTYLRSQNESVSPTSFSRSLSEISNVGVVLDQPLAPGVGLQVSANAGRTLITDVTGTEERADQTLLVRMTTLPARNLALDGWLSYVQTTGPLPILGMALRAEPWRGLLLDGSYESGPSAHSWFATLRMAPSPETTVWASASASTSSADGQVYAERRNAASLLMRLAGSTDVTIDYSHASGTGATPWGFTEWSASILHRPNAMLTYRLGYSIFDDLLDGTWDQTNALWGDVSWLLSPRASLSLSARGEASSQGLTTVSAAWLRWTLTSRSDLLLSYRREVGPDTDTSGGFITLIRRLSDQTNLQLTYDTQTSGGESRQIVALVFQGQVTSGW